MSILELWWMRNTFSLLLLSGLHGPGMVVSVSVPSMGQIDPLKIILVFVYKEEKKTLNERRWKEFRYELMGLNEFVGLII